jgi:hypothetical protein
VFTRALGADDLALGSAVWISLDELDLMKEALRRHQRAIKGPSRGHQGSSGVIKGSSKGHQGFIKGSSRGHQGLDDLPFADQDEEEAKVTLPVALRGTQMHSDALRCTQMHSDALRCTQMH